MFSGYTTFEMIAEIAFTASDSINFIICIYGNQETGK